MHLITFSQNSSVRSHLNSTSFMPQKHFTRSFIPNTLRRSISISLHPHIYVYLWSALDRMTHNENFDITLCRLSYSSSNTIFAQIHSCFKISKIPSLFLKSITESITYLYYKNLQNWQDLARTISEENGRTISYFTRLVRFPMQRTFAPWLLTEELTTKNGNAFLPTLASGQNGENLQREPSLKRARFLEFRCFFARQRAERDMPMAERNDTGKHRGETAQRENNQRQSGAKLMRFLLNANEAKNNGGNIIGDRFNSTGHYSKTGFIEKFRNSSQILPLFLLLSSLSRYTHPFHIRKREGIFEKGQEIISQRRPVLDIFTYVTKSRSALFRYFLSGLKLFNLRPAVSFVFRAAGTLREGRLEFLRHRSCCLWWDTSIIRYMDLISLR